MAFTNARFVRKALKRYKRSFDPARAAPTDLIIQDNTTMPMIRIHHGEGPAPVGLRMTKGYDLDTGTTNRGGTSLIYLFKSKKEFGA